MHIDFVIPWVDNSDPVWRTQRDSCLSEQQIPDESRYRDWDTLRYWFRAVEKYAPWVNRIFFITCGHLPDWLNQSHPKLRIISHSDYIPQEYLPTFSANPIELNLHRIPDLTETFVYFNDDTFLNAPVSPEDFFIAGLPCNCAVMEPFLPVEPGDPYPHILLNDMAFINRHFHKQSVLKQNKSKWYHPVYGKYLLKNMYYTPGALFSGFRNLHIPSSMKKSTFNKVWSLEPELLHNACKNKFRSLEDVNQNIFTFYDLCCGNFSPRSAQFGKCYGIGISNEEMYTDLLIGKHKLICINDHPNIKAFEQEKANLITVFQQKLPQKSAFEL